MGAPAQTMSVWVLFCLAGIAAIPIVLLTVKCKIRAVLWLEPSGGAIVLYPRLLVPLAPFYFRIALLQPPYLAIDLVKHNGQISPIYRAFLKEKKANPWGAAIWNSVRWKEVRAHLRLGIAEAPACAVILWGATQQMLSFMLKRHLCADAIVCGRPLTDQTNVRLKVEGMATVRAAQIIHERLRIKKEKRNSNVTPH